jgi:hypothetical protein
MKTTQFKAVKKMGRRKMEGGQTLCTQNKTQTVVLAVICLNYHSNQTIKIQYWSVVRSTKRGDTGSSFELSRFNHNLIHGFTHFY